MSIYTRIDQLQFGNDVRSYYDKEYGYLLNPFTVIDTYMGKKICHFCFITHMWASQKKFI